MSIDAHKALVRRFFEEGWNKQKMDVFDEGFTADFVLHDPAAPDVRSLGDLRQWVSDIHRTFPDMRFTIEDTTAEGDKVVARWTWCATDSVGGQDGRPPTGRRITNEGISIHRLADGKVVEIWNGWDAQSFNQQLWD